MVRCQKSNLQKAMHCLAEADAMDQSGGDLPQVGKWGVVFQESSRLKQFSKDSIVKDR